MALHVVANVNARGLAAPSRRGSDIEALCRGRAHLHVTRDVAELEAVMAEVVSRPCDLLVLAGGDGTFMSGTTALVAALDGRPAPTVGLLPMGTVGTTARNFGEPGDPMVLLDRWLRVFSGHLDGPPSPRHVRIVPRPTLRIAARTDDGRTSERIGFIVGTGLVARFFEVYEAEGAGGIPLAGRIVARVFAESIFGGPLARRILTPMPCELRVDGRRHDTSALSLLCAAVVRDLGLGMKVSYRAGERTDRIHLVASSLEPRHLGPRMPFVMMGRSIGGERHVDDLVERFEVRFPDDRGAYVVDGDMFRARAIEVSPGPLVPILGPRG
jgi:diacylglycerol kinase family enzyme